MIVCGWCGVSTPEGACASCGRDAALPWTQRGLQATRIPERGSGRPRLDPAALRLRLAAAAYELDGRAPTTDALAEALGVDGKTVRRWAKLSGYRPVSAAAPR